MTLLNLETIEKSPYITIDGEEIVDLTSPILNDGMALVFNESDKKYQVGSDMLAKPSVLAQFIFGDSSKLDYIAYYNGFSNVFAIPAGFVLQIPEITRLTPMVGSNGEFSEINLSRDLFNKKASVVDEKRRRMITTDIERPNMNETLQQNVKLSDRIILGNNSSKDDSNKNFSFIHEEPLDELLGLTDYYEELLAGG